MAYEVVLHTEIVSVHVLVWIELTNKIAAETMLIIIEIVLWGLFLGEILKYK